MFFLRTILPPATMTAPGQDSDHNDEEQQNHTEEESDGSSTNTSISPRRREQRRRILFQVLFRHIINHRSAAQQESASSSSSTAALLPPEALIKPVRIILSDSEALSIGAQCRFCFEGPSPQQQVSSSSSASLDITAAIIIKSTPERNRLIAPCNCSGGSEWVHLACLRAWQRQASVSSSRQNAATFCNVCTSPYLVPPLPPPRLRNNLLQKGTLLVARNTGGTFERSVVLLLNDLEGSRTGIIINSPLPREVTHEVASQIDDVGINMEWRRGGPVCGGRLGVVRYMVAHELCVNENNNQGQAEDSNSTPIFEEDVEQHRDQNQDQSQIQGGEEVGRTSLIRLLCEFENHEVPLVFDRDELPDVLRRLNRRLLPVRQQNNSTPSPSSLSQREHGRGKVIIFAGFCKWARGQLEREIQRNAWNVCHGRAEDVLCSNSHNSSGASSLWEKLTTIQQGRLLTADQLLADPSAE